MLTLMSSARLSAAGETPAPDAVDRRRQTMAGTADRLTRRVWVVYGIAALCVVGYLVLLIIGHDGETWPWLDNWAVPGFEFVITALCFLRAAVVRRGRAIALLLGIGLLCWSLGDLVLAIESSSGNPPVPSWADLFYLLFYPVTYAGLALRIGRQVKHWGVSTWLDGAVAGLGAGAIVAAFVFHGVLRSAGGGTAAVVTNLAYPIGDLLLLVLVVGTTAVIPGRRKAQWILIAAGYSLQAIGDTFNLFGSGIGATHFGSAFNAVAWPASILLVSSSVWLPTTRTDPRLDERAPGFLLPGLASIAAMSILFVGSVQHIDTAALVLATATLVGAGIRTALSLTALRHLTSERHEQAITDQLTSLGNRRALFELLDAIAAETETSDAEPRELAFLFVDLNRFKEVNDSFGHSVGDELLRQLGERLTGSLRDCDLLVRLGGDEFAVVLMDAGSDYATTVAQRISGRLEEPFQLGAVRAQISASIGIAEMPADAADTPGLLQCADLAMYRAKLELKPFAIYSEELDGHGNRGEFVEELRTAILNGDLELHYQPQVDVHTGHVVGVEALARWSHPRLGYVPPLEFLPLAEEAGLMDVLTELVLERALTQCARWRAAGEDLAISVNISTTNLANAEFATIVDRLLRSCGVPAEALVLEITETTAIIEFDRCKRVIEELRDLGIVVSVDDFGAGFTSLAYLSSLAVGELKLDRSFISGLATADEARDLALVRSTIELAHSLGLRVVAEGVEDEASFELLADLACDVAQGYLIGKPQPAEQVALGRYLPSVDAAA
jgi:diguanylate cyclase (GGDEF)-like protein